VLDDIQYQEYKVIVPSFELDLDKEDLEKFDKLRDKIIRELQERFIREILFGR
jgi:hypothetical protein